MENTNSTICAGLEPGNGESLVSWQSAWWALVAIAMNSISSPNGKVLGFPSSWGEVLRSSPLICLFDALEMSSFWLFVMVFNREGPCAAARRVADVRFSDCERDQSLRTIRSRFLITQAGFSIAVLTQVIKLFAMRGVIGCQICAFFYLYSWALSQALMLCAGQNTTTSLPPLRPGPDGSIISQGLLPYVPFHTIGLISHTVWLYGLQNDLLYNSFFHKGLPFNDEVDTIAWSILLVLFSVVIHFLLVKMDSTRSIDFPSTLAVHGFIITSIATISMFRAWNAVIDIFFRKGGRTPGAYIGNNWDPLTELHSCAFTLATRKKINGTLARTILLINIAFVFPFSTKCRDHLVAFTLPDVLLGSLLDLMALAATLCSIIEPWVALRIPQQLSAWLTMVTPQRFTKSHVQAFAGALVGGILLIVLCIKKGPTTCVCWKMIYFLLLLCDSSLGSDKTISFEVGGACFVGANLVWPLLWFWQVWQRLHPECTAKPGWTEYLG